MFLSLFIHHISFHFFYPLFLHFIFYVIVFILLITPVAHINTGGKHTIYFFNIMVLDGLQHNFSFLFFYKIFAIGLIDGIMHFFTHFKICLDGKIDFFFEPKNAIARYIIRPDHVLFIINHQGMVINALMEFQRLCFIFLNFD